MRESSSAGSGRDHLENEKDQSTEEAACPHEEEMRGDVEHRMTSGGHTQPPYEERVTAFQEYK